MPCLCQRYGKSGVPGLDTDRCLVCGEAVDYTGAWISSCRQYRPDHNGECLTCDEPYDAHSPEAIAEGERRRDAGRPSYTCPRCGAVSFNPHDSSERYCGRCHQFEERRTR